MPDSSPHSTRFAEQVRATAEPGSPVDLLVQDYLDLVEQYENLMARAEKAETRMDTYRLMLRDEKARVAELEEALREILNEPFGDVPLDAQAIACRALGGGEV